LSIIISYQNLVICFSSHLP